MNRNHWEDIRRFCLVYVQLDAEVCPRPLLTSFKLFSQSLLNICFCFSHSSGDLITYAVLMSGTFPTLYQTESNAIMLSPICNLVKKFNNTLELGILDIF